MALNFIYTLQLNIHQILVESEKIKRIIKEVYLSVVQDGNYPFILINIIRIEDKSKNIQQIYSIDFEICIFSRDKNKKTLLLVSELVDDVITIRNIAVQGYETSGVKLIDVSFGEAKDLIHNKLIMKYKSLLKQDLD